VGKWNNRKKIERSIQRIHNKLTVTVFQLKVKGQRSRSVITISRQTTLSNRQDFNLFISEIDVTENESRAVFRQEVTPVLRMRRETSQQRAQA